MLAFVAQRNGSNQFDIYRLPADGAGLNDQKADEGCER
jgi:hypothetical protein